MTFTIHEKKYIAMEHFSCILSKFTQTTRHFCRYGNHDWRSIADMEIVIGVLRHKAALKAQFDSPLVGRCDTHPQEPQRNQEPFTILYS